MKKLFTILSFSMIVVFSFSQSYHKLIRTNTYWDVFDITQPVTCYSYANRIYFTNNDTVIDGNLYRISRQHYFQQINPGAFCPPFVILNDSYNTMKFLREDTINKKVYIYCQECYPPKDDLFYDFSLNVGDTLKSFWAGYGLTLICSSIENVTLFNGETRQKFNFSNGYPNGDFYIESLGGQQGLFDPIVPAIGSSGGYFCQSENGTNLWGIDCNNYFVGVDQQIPNKYLVSPNPAHDFVNISLISSPEIIEFIISNVQGKIVLRKILINERNKIPLSGLVPGVYYYEIKSSDNNVIGKIIIF